MAKAAKRRSKTAKKRSGTTRRSAVTRRRMIGTLSGDRPGHEVASDLRKAGLDVEQVLDAIGSVTGASASRNMLRLRAVRGVADVSREHPPFNIGPPDAPSPS